MLDYFAEYADTIRLRRLALAVGTDLFRAGKDEYGTGLVRVYFPVYADLEAFVDLAAEQGAVPDLMG